ncbi:MAG: bifunctional phosphoribosylaminoimidazolecarboxamide formyltransferase/IMP cyclohydrolase, partial [Actinomycetales bacterium]|nr:bifunctional phosphoribosylaminoimidazolecarboxamide formyltransferase/IMP cyclohydrolase [Actinomycetales bacterium]
MAAHNDHQPADYRHRDRIQIKRALLSVSDKTGLLELAQALVNAGVSIISTGGTYSAIKNAGLPVTEVAEVTGFPETLDGRVKTLHPKIHAGILADMRLIAHEGQLDALKTLPFELVVVNLYPFVQTVQSGAKGDAVVEQIDIGGPAMVRAAAKNHANVAIVVDPAKYGEVINALAEGGTTLSQRRLLARDAFSHTAKYDSAVAGWFDAELEGDWRKAAGASAQAESKNPGFESTLTIEGELGAVLRYGENAHQAAALYRRTGEGASAGIAQARQFGGKEMSYNNYVDADAALRAAYDFSEPAVAIIKHANPCGIAIGDPNSPDPIADAHAKAYVCDTISAFGGVIAANRTITVTMAQQIASVFTEVVVAPGYDTEALQILLAKPNLRVLQLPADYRRESLEVRQISGGLLLQQMDEFSNFSSTNWQLVAGK